MIDFERIFDASPTPYMLLRSDPPTYTIAAVNKAYLAATNTEYAGMVGHGLFEVFPENPDDVRVSGPSDLRISLDRVLRDRRADVMGIQKYDIPLRDGREGFEPRYWSPTNVPVIDERGSVPYILHRAEDVTEFILAGEGDDPAGSGTQSREDRMEAEVRRASAELKDSNRTLKSVSDELEEANARLEGIDRLKTEFFSNVSHEFRTPLTLMLGPLDELMEMAQPDEQRQLTATAQRNARRLLKLVNTLLDFSRIEAGRTRARFVATDLALLTAELASSFDSACSDAGIGLVIDCPPLGGPVAVDPDMWEKIVLNLLSNAFKFTFDGEIAIRLRTEGDHVVLTVRDSGVGIPEPELALIFERFHRVEGQRGRSYEGSGIGLSLVRELARMLGGDIAVTSEEGAGTQFTVTIPRVRADADQAGNPPAPPAPNQVARHAAVYARQAEDWLVEDRDLAPPPGAETTATEEGVGQGRRVLLVDDNVDMRTYIARILSKAGYEVQTVGDADAALVALGEGAQPDLVLSDVMMPGSMDGFGLLRTLRASPATETLPVMLLSARAGMEARIEGLDAGADEYIVKPFGSRELLARIDSALRLGALRHEEARRQRELVAARAEARLRVAMDTARMGEVLFDLTAGTLVHSTGFAALYHQPADRQMTLADVLGATHPEDRAALREALAQVDDGRAAHLEVEHRILWPNGTIHWLSGRIGMGSAGAGDVPVVTGVFLDISERKWVEEQQKLLLDELNHRVKNTLSTVLSIAVHSRSGAKTLEEFDPLFEGRITALAGAHDLLTQASWESASLTDVVGQTLRPFGPMKGETARVHYGGPLVRLSPNAAVTLNMAFHELATNAAKFGALSVAEGRLDVDWTIDRACDPPVVDLTWRERDGPPVTPPRSRGFGTKLVDQGVSRELDGKVALHYEPEGFSGHIRLPVSQKVMVL